MIFRDKAACLHKQNAKDLDEASQLTEAGFEYVTEMDNTKILRKKKYLVCLANV